MKKVSFDELMVMAKRPDRGVLLETLSQLCLASGRRLSQRERALVYDIFRTLLHNVEMRVRRTLAEHLSDRNDAPHDLIYQLANDVIEVAYPVLQRSKVLEDTDLMSLIFQHPDRRREAIAKRMDLSEEVSESLVDTGDPEVLRSLVTNPTAHLSQEVMERLVDAAAELENIREPLLQREDMSPELAKRMYAWVGEALRSYITESYDLDENVDDAVSRAVAEAIETDIFADDGRPDLERYASNISFRPSAEALIKTLEDGDIFRFEELFRELTELSPGSVTKVLYDSGPEGLAIACRAVGFDEEEYGEIYCHMQGSRPFEHFRNSKPYRRAIEYFRRMDTAGARRVMQTWRETPDDSWG